MKSKRMLRDTAAGSSGSGNAADLILHNARVITLDPAHPRADWVAIRGSRILAVGDGDDLGLFRGARTRLSDCQGGAVVPGFNDAHCHPLSRAVSLLSVDCSPAAVENIAGIQAGIRDRAAQTEEGAWIRASGYDESHLQERRPPTRQELDQASPCHPLILVHSTAGSCVLNSLALRLAGITRDTPDSAGPFRRDPTTGEPDGLITGRSELVEKAVPSLDEDEIEQGMRLVNKEYLSRGITSVQDTSWANGWRNWQLWRSLIERGTVSFRVSLLLGTAYLAESQDAGLSMGSGDSRLKVGGIKVALDESTGCPHPPQEDLDSVALQAHSSGFRVAFHVSDVPMLQASLAAISFVRQRTPGADHRFRLEHCAICPPELVLRIRASRAIVVTQPSFLYYLGQKFRAEVLPHQSSWFQPVGSWQRWRVKVAFSSDSPLMPSDPMRGIYAAVTRKTETGERLAPQESVSVLDALRMYTLGGAYASFEEGEKGTISPGKFADLAVLSDDPTRVDPEQLSDLRVVRTIVDGKVVMG